MRFVFLFREIETEVIGRVFRVGEQQHPIVEAHHPGSRDLTEEPELGSRVVVQGPVCESAQAGKYYVGYNSNRFSIWGRRQNRVLDL